MKWIKDEYVTQEFIELIERQGVVDHDGYRYVLFEMFGKNVIGRTAIDTYKKKVVSFPDYELVLTPDIEDSFTGCELHKIVGDN